MDVEIGIQNIARTVTFTTNQSAEEISSQLTDAVTKGETADFVDAKGRHVLIPGKAVGYAVIGAETAHPVGFGQLG